MKNKLNKNELNKNELNNLPKRFFLAMVVVVIYLFHAIQA
jgi:hypothetical protein